MLILGQKGSNLDQKGPNWAGLDIFHPVNINFPKEDHKLSFYTKNQQNSMNRSGDISQNADFGPKRDNFGLKRAKLGGARYFPACKDQFSKRRP